MAVYESLLLNTAVPQIQAAQAGDSYVMVVNATTPALRITQTGTGNALEVEDSANPDSSPFVVTAAGDVGIGTASPTFKLQVIGTSQLSLSAAGTQQALQLNNSDTTAGTQAVKLGFSSAGVTKASINAAVYGNDYMTFNVGSDIERARITSTGTLNIVGAGTAGSTQAISFNGSTPVDTLVTTSGGLVGIGTSSPSTYNAKLVSYGSFGTSTPAFSLVNASAENASNIAESQYWLANSFSGLVNVAKIGAISGTTGNQYGSLYFSTSNAGAPTERMRLDASGNLGLGVTPSAWDASGAGGPVLQIQRALLFGANTETRLIHNAYYGTGDFRYIASGVAATNYQQASGQHRWFTAPSGTANDPITFTQAMTLDASGNLLVGTTSGAEKLVVSGTINNYVIKSIAPSTSGTYYHILFDDAGTSHGSITSNGTNTAYNTTSDYRLKDNPQPLINSGAFVDALQPKTWTWKADGSKGVGFIAHEVQEVSPGSVVGEKDGEQMQAMEYGSAEFIANIVAELQSLRARVAQLEQGA